MYYRGQRSSTSASYTFRCSLCKTGVITVKDQILSHLDSKQHIKKCHEYVVEITATDENGGSCLTHDLLEAYKQKKGISAPTTLVLRESYQPADGDFPSLGGAPLETPSQSSSNLDSVASIAASSPASRMLNDPNAFPALGNAASPSLESGTSVVSRPIGRGRGRLLTAGSSVASVPGSVVSSATSQSNVHKSHLAAIESASVEPAKLRTARQILNEWLRGTKDGLMAANEICKCMRWAVDYEEIEPVAGEGFSFYVLINGAPAGSPGNGGTKQKAKRNACQNIQKTLSDWIRQKEMDSEKELGIGPDPRKTPMDHYGEMAFGKLRQLRNPACDLAGQMELPSHFAAFIITTSSLQQAQNGTVVAIGTGTHILPKSEANLINAEDCGRSVYDMRALSVARRAFQLFLASQLKALLTSSSSDVALRENLFIEPNHYEGGFVKLKTGYNLHLFMSHAPDGDAVVDLMGKREQTLYSAEELERDINGNIKPSPVDLDHRKGCLRLSTSRSPPHDLSVVSVPTMDCMNVDMTNGSLRCMSLSDKLLVWCRVGFQGSLLSQWFRTPLRPYSIQMGMNYDHSSFVRAVFCRLPMPNENNRLKGKPPFMGRMTHLPTNYSATSQPYSWNYALLQKQQNSTQTSSTANSVEVLDTREGRVVKSGLPSRLSRVASMQRYYLLNILSEEYFSDKPHLKRLFLHCPDLLDLTYAQLKRVTGQENYRRGKERLLEVLEENGLGTWHGRPNEFQAFRLSDFAVPLR